METKMLYYYAKFQKMSDIEKRQLFNKLVKERLRIECEARIHKILTRLTFQTLRKKHGENFTFTKDEQKLAEIFKELNLSPSTCHKWYYSTFEKIKPIQTLKSECSACSIKHLCEHTVPKELIEKINNKYEYELVTKRLQQILVKIELFRNELNNTWTEEEIRTCLRRLVEKDYYRKEIELPNKAGDIITALKKRKIKAMTALKWFYVIKNSPELLKKAQQNEIMSDEVFDKSMIKLKNELRGDIHANINVC
ncbi:hypothetical protein KY346_00205 [Candidatus Woesearchaeota archaeon]|nr:hypothetical protein [Candidatus Woesearchaeota archaeon]